jgi:hypothetical protein
MKMGGALGGVSNFVPQWGVTNCISVTMYCLSLAFPKAPRAAQKNVIHSTPAPDPMWSGSRALLLTLRILLRNERLQRQIPPPPGAVRRRTPRK